MATDPSPSPRGVLRRADKIMTAEQIDAFLDAAFCGRVASVGADGHPYILPNLFIWHERVVYLHTVRGNGHFATNVSSSDRVCFEADEPGEVFPYGHVECDTSVSYRSVVIFGRIRVVDDREEVEAFFRRFLRKYAPADSWGRQSGSFPRMHGTTVYAIAPEMITGKAGHLPDLDQRWPLKNNSLSPDWHSNK